MKECEAMDSVAKELEKEGVSLAFHNHDAEFSVMVRGVPAHYLMAANTQYLKFELDTGWADFGGYNPVSIMKELGDRLAMVHIKDYVPAVTTERPQAPDGRHIVVPVFTSRNRRARFTRLFRDCSSSGNRVCYSGAGTL